MTLDTCYYCGQEYNSDAGGYTHDSDCECWYCDPEHDEYEEYGYPIVEHVKEHGFLNLCSVECEDNFIREGG